MWKEDSKASLDYRVCVCVCVCERKRTSAACVASSLAASLHSSVAPAGPTTANFAYLLTAKGCFDASPLLLPTPTPTPTPRAALSVLADVTLAVPTAAVLGPALLAAALLGRSGRLAAAAVAVCVLVSGGGAVGLGGSGAGVGWAVGWPHGLGMMFVLPRWSS